MRDPLVLDVADCSEFRQTLLARPPAIVHGTTLLLVTLLGSALTWAYLTKADLVVRATGHVRPVTAPRQVYVDFHGDATSPGVAVAEVKYRQGDEVQAGDVLIRMDTKRLDTEIRKRDIVMQAAEKALEQLQEQQELLAEQSDKARAEAVAELDQVEKETQLAKTRQTLAVQIAEKELTHARSKLARFQLLLQRQAGSPADFDEVRLQVQRAESDLAKAQLPVLEEKVEVCRRKLARLEKDFLLKRMELSKEQANKQRELDTARTERSRLELERGQAVVLAPIGGVVTSREVKVGDIPEPGKPVVEIAEQKGFRFEVAISSEDVAPIKAGMPARIRIDAYDYQKYGTLGGRVCFIAPDAKIDEGQRVAKYLVKVELDGDEVGRGELRGRVRLGMAGQAEIVTDRESLLTLLLKKIRRTISLG